MTNAFMVRYYARGGKCLSLPMVSDLPLLGDMEQLSYYGTTVYSMAGNPLCAPFSLWRIINKLTKQVLGILVCWTSTANGGLIFFRGTTIRIGLAYYSASAFLTSMLTGMFSCRLVRHGRILKGYRACGYAYPCFAIAVLAVESLLPYTLSGIAFLVSLGLGSRMTSMFESMNVLPMVRSGLIISGCEAST